MGLDNFLKVLGGLRDRGGGGGGEGGIVSAKAYKRTKNSMSKQGSAT